MALASRAGSLRVHSKSERRVRAAGHYEAAAGAGELTSEFEAQLEAEAARGTERHVDAVAVDYERPQDAAANEREVVQTGELVA